MSNNKILMAEINTWIWLKEMERKYARHMTLDRIPPVEWEEIIDMGFNAIWLMGIWRRSPQGRIISQENEKLFSDYSQSLPDWGPVDLPGSPYCIKEYVVDARFGGIAALEKVHKDLKNKGIRLILDFVPNHLAIDNLWVERHPDYFIHGNSSDLEREPEAFFQSNENIFAYGRDPFFPPWQDVVQVNAFSQDYRDAVKREFSRITRMCDGVRCDMAMLLITEIFARTWQGKVGAAPDREFWEELIAWVKELRPEFVFYAEVYWGKEMELLQYGFDYCYDKGLYDGLLHDDACSIRKHLESPFEYQEHLLRFLENHDEPRVAELLPIKKQKAASLVAYTLPGASLLYEGQWEGRSIKTHVLLGRRQPERVNRELLEFYKNLLQAVKRIHEYGSWELCTASGWQNNDTYKNLITYTWQSGGFKDLVVVNYSEEQSQGRIHLPWAEIKEKDLLFTDNLEHVSIKRSGLDIKSKGLFVDLPPWGYHFLSTYLR